MNPKQTVNQNLVPISDAAKIKRRFSVNFGINLTGRLVYMLTRFLLQPLTLSYVTLEEFGIWATCFIVISYLGVSVLGISNVYVRYVAEYYARNEIEKIGRLLSTGVMLISGIGMTLLTIVWFVLPKIIDLFNVPASLHGTATIFIFVTALISMLELSFGAFGTALGALQRVKEQSVVWIAVCSLEAVLIVVFLLNGLGIFSLLWAFVIRSVISIPVNIVVCYRLLPQLSIGIRQFDRTMLRLFFGYGTIVQASSLLGVFLYSIEKVLAAYFFGVGAAGLIDVGEKWAITASAAPATMNSLFLPVMSHLRTLNQRHEVAQLYLKGARYLNILMGVLMGFLAGFASPLIIAWVGADQKYQNASLILMIFCLPYQLHHLTGPASAFHRSGQAARELFYPLTQLLLVALFVALGFLWFGKTVLVICATVGLAMALSACFYIRYSNRLLEIKSLDFIRLALIPGLLPYIIGIGAAWLARPWILWAGSDRSQLLLVLSAAGVFYLALTGLVSYKVICSPTERESMRKNLIQLYRRLLAMRHQPV